MLPAARLLIVEDHPLYRDGLLALLQRSAPALQCRVAESAEAALLQLQAHPDTDLVLSDLRLPGVLDGLALLAEVGRRWPTMARVLVSGSDEPHLPQQARAAGLMGYLPKGMEPVMWLHALSRVLAGDPWFPLAAAAPEPGPTERQRAILGRLAEGHSNKAMAREFGITERTVKYHLAEIYRRLDAGNRAEAVARGTARGWIRLA
ncbi:MAG: response regulator transcription factor [Rubrivivax sp.]|nr:response regulator transcription factor [Rubrivivax sp.]